MVREEITFNGTVELIDIEGNSNLKFYYDIFQKYLTKSYIDVMEEG